MGLHEFVRRKV